MRRPIKSLVLLLALAALMMPLPVSAEQGGDSKKKGTHSPNEGAPKASESGGLGGQKVYVSIGPVILPVIDDNGPQQIVTLIVSLQVADTSASDKVRQQFPRLVDAYVRALYGRLDQNVMHNGVIVNIDFIKRKIFKATQEIMKDNTVEDVLIQAVAQRQV